MASFEYKCRRCGEIDLNPHCGEELANRELINVCFGFDSDQPQAPTLYGIHLCSDGGRGVSDIQGFRLDKPAGQK